LNKPTTDNANHQSRQSRPPVDATRVEMCQPRTSASADAKATTRQRLAVHFSSATDQWPTPQWFFDALDAEFGFDLDVCASPEHAKCRRFFEPAVDGLKQRWEGVCWMNPPYGRGIGAWVRKAYESSLLGATVCCLLPARTDTQWWHRYVMRATEVRFLKGRLKFGDAKAGAPFPSAIVIFGTLKPSISSIDAAALREGRAASIRRC
jgi:phage N-6-adenine-methyltransferase